MKTKIFFGLTLIFLPFLMACNGNSEDSEDVKDSLICIYPAPELIERARWLIGDWEQSSEDGLFQESWKQLNDSTFSGEAYFLAYSSAELKSKGGFDTLASEKIEIKQIGEDLFYIPTVSNQNDGLPISFRMTFFSSEELVFENPEHDFPQKIVYRNFSGDSILAEVSGLRNGAESVEKFPMKRRK